MNSDIFWAAHLKNATGYDVENDGLEWDKAKCAHRYTQEDDPATTQGVLYFVLKECFPYFQKKLSGVLS